jgi:hypothetical protein
MGEQKHVDEGGRAKMNSSDVRKEDHSPDAKNTII